MTILLCALLIVAPVPPVQPQKDKPRPSLYPYPYFDASYATNLSANSTTTSSTTPEWLVEMSEPAATEYSQSPPVPPPAEPPATVPEPPPPPLTLRERALNRFVELGAAPWAVNVFDCIGWRESKWSNVRSPTGDDGVLQINDVHDQELARQGLDPYVPEDAATFAWQLSRGGTSFRAWTVHGLCGV